MQTLAMEYPLIFWALIALVVWRIIAGSIR